MGGMFTSLASLMGVLAFCQTLLATLFPPELRFSFVKFINRLTNYFSIFCYFDITEIDGVNTNELYNAVQLYLSNSASITGNRLSLTRALNSSAVTFGLSKNDTLTDTFNGITVQWEHIVTQRNSQGFISLRPLPEEKRGFMLRVKKSQKEVVLNSYLDYIMERSSEIKRKNEDRCLYTNSRGGSMDPRGHHPWEAVPFKHPSTFDTLAMDPKRKFEIMDDLTDFANGRSFYQKTGRAWKRGYLLYGPPGTGKSSMIAAMANYLNYDIYDLELTEVNSNSELRKLLMKTTSKSIIVIEDIDCSINLTNRNNNAGVGHPMGRRATGGFAAANPSMSVEDDSNGYGTGKSSITLSALLNFTDGIWSCCGSERIFVFTTNHIDKLDPALLRSGRMDMHIFMSCCSFQALKILIKNYLGEIEDEEEVMKEYEAVIDEVQMTPADISELLIRNRRDKRKALMDLLEELKRRIKEKAQEKKGLKCEIEDKVEEELEEEEEEEQEKRALEREMSPAAMADEAAEDNCKVADQANQKHEQNK